MANNGKRIVGARQDSKGNISAVLLQGNKTFTPIKTAIGMTRRGEINAVAVKPKDAIEHIRSRPDSKIANNLDELAKK